MFIFLIFLKHLITNGQPWIFSFGLFLLITVLIFGNIGKGVYDVGLILDVFIYSLLKL
ncbi:MAG: hypothetical protein AB8V73_02300 [Coxiella endosymbiont of Dermacentor nuttalli]